MLPPDPSFVPAAPPASPRPLDPSTLVAGRFEIARTVAPCGRGFLYAARDAQDGRDVTLEVVPSALAADLALAQELEARTARTARLPGEGIARPRAAGVDAALGAFWIAHEPFEGESLRTRIARGRVTPREAVAIVTRLLDALAPAHAAGDVHRGLEPDDVVLVREADGREGVRILDFGLPRAIAAEAVSPYVSPEQARSSAWLTPAADTFSVAAIFYELVAGSAPGSPRAPLGEVAPQTPPAVSALVERALSVDPGLRPMGAKEMREALDRALAPAPPAQPAAAPGSSGHGGPQRHGPAPLVNDGALRPPLSGAEKPKRGARWAWVVALIVVLTTCLLLPAGMLAVAALLLADGESLLPSPDPPVVSGTADDPPPVESGTADDPPTFGQGTADDPPTFGQGTADDPPSAAQGADAPDADRLYTVKQRLGAPSLGSASAPVTIALFSDFQCPFCARLKPTLEAVLAENPGRVRVVWRNYPLPFHADARLAAEAALEAQAQGGDGMFWQMHEKLFENPRALDRASLERYARELGLDGARFARALDTHVHGPAIDADIAAADATGLSMGTPTCFVNGRAVQGAQPLSVFRDAVARALAR